VTGQARILVVDDEPTIRFALREFLDHHGYDVVEADSCQAARRVFHEAAPDAVVLDYSLPDGTALDLLPVFRAEDPSAPVIVLTAHGSIDLAVRAIKDGAEQFLTKPVELPALLVVIVRALENQRNWKVRTAVASQDTREAIAVFPGESAAMRRLERDARVALDAASPILLLGETGAGKGVLARWLHENGGRAGEPFVDLNCAGLSRELLESELFGHEKGAFTGAVATKPGLLEAAHRGTLFLDEIGDMTPASRPASSRCSRNTGFAGWATSGNAGWTFGSSAPRITTSMRGFRRGRSGTISIIGSVRYRSGCLHSASEPRTSFRWRR